jgi:4-amino-4-deoxy-L-arabinose transferase-like glycosyltransferase
MNNLPIPSKKRKTVLEILFLIFCGSIIFLPRLHELPYKGEEPRRVICAQELLLSGNLFVPTIQNELFLSRPPFQNWIIALTGKMLGNFGHLSGRLPSFLSVLATTLLIYFYCRTFFHGIVVSFATKVVL